MQLPAHFPGNGRPPAQAIGKVSNVSPCHAILLRCEDDRRGDVLTCVVVSRWELPDVPYQQSVRASLMIGLLLLSLRGSDIRRDVVKQVFVPGPESFLVPQ
jgi:hypothetical protein